MQSPSRSTARAQGLKEEDATADPLGGDRGVGWAWPACPPLPPSSRLCLWVLGPPGDLFLVRTGTSNLQSEVNSPSS